LAEIISALPQFTEQPRVLDGDDGLSSEVLQQLDVFFGERLYLLAIHVNRADELALLEHWHRHKGPRAHGFDEANDEAIFPDVGLIGPKVGNVDNLLAVGDTV